jgi:uncharacterized phage infection (PIP) family protein YhgE
MSSPHFRTAAKYLEENIDLFSKELDTLSPEQKILWNMSNALLAMSDAIEDEFRELDARLTSLQMGLHL